MTARYLIGDTRQVLRTLPDNSVDLVLTSPPFLALRSYLPADHPDKALEMGSEPTPGEFIDALLDVVEECSRVLAPHGSIAIELGDTYSGSGGAGGDYGPAGLRDGQQVFAGSAARTRSNRPGQYGTTEAWPTDKSLCLIPESFRWALAYGRNPFTGRQTPTWRVRNVVRWHRPNPPVGALGDKFRPATSDMVIACLARDRYFDLDAVREPATTPDSRGAKPYKRQMAGRLGGDGDNPASASGNNPAGAPPLDTWIIPTQPYAGSHYATWPEALCVKPIKAMCPLKVCTICGQPSRRIIRPIASLGHRVEDGADGDNGTQTAKSVNETVGWTDCGHDSWRTGVVLDPFAGSGTTLAVATGHGRDAIGIDLDARNADLAMERVGPMFLTVEHPDPEAAA